MINKTNSKNKVNKGFKDHYLELKVKVIIRTDPEKEVDIDQLIQGLNQRIICRTDGAFLYYSDILEHKERDIIHVENVSKEVLDECNRKWLK